MAGPRLLHGDHRVGDQINLGPSDSSVRGWAEAVETSDNSNDAAGDSEVVTGMEELGRAVVIVPGNTDTRLIGLGSLPEPLRRLYGCETAGRGRGWREGAVAAAAAREREEEAGNNNMFLLNFPNIVLQIFICLSNNDNYKITL
jgi:hypothetical protein